MERLYAPRRVPEPELSTEQAQAIVLLSEGLGVTTVAERVGVDRRTIWRWRQAPHFLAELQRRREDLLDHGARTLASVVPDATAALAAIVRDPSADATVRLRAAEAILDRVGLGPTQRVEVVEADPEARLLELLGIGTTDAIELTEEPETTEQPEE